MAPSNSVPKTSHGPIIQPMSVSQKSVSSGMQVEPVQDVLRGLDRESAMRMHRALRRPVVPEV